MAKYCAFFIENMHFYAIYYCAPNELTYTNEVYNDGIIRVCGVLSLFFFDKYYYNAYNHSNMKSPRNWVSFIKPLVLFFPYRI